MSPLNVFLKPQPPQGPVIPSPHRDPFCDARVRNCASSVMVPRRLHCGVRTTLCGLHPQRANPWVCILPWDLAVCVTRPMMPKGPISGLGRQVLSRPLGLRLISVRPVTIERVCRPLERQITLNRSYPRHTVGRSHRPIRPHFDQAVLRRGGAVSAMILMGGQVRWHSFAVLLRISVRNAIQRRRVYGIPSTTPVQEHGQGPLAWYHKACASIAIPFTSRLEKADSGMPWGPAKTPTPRSARAATGTTHWPRP